MDPVSVAMAASSAFTLLKKGIAAGKEIEDMGLPYLNGQVLFLTLIT